MGRVPLLSRRLSVRFQNPFHKGFRWLQFRSLSHRCLSLRWNSAEHGLTHHPPVNPQLLGDSSDRSPTVLILASYLLEKLHLASPVHRPSLGPTEPEGDTRYMSFSRVGPNQTIERGQIRVAESIARHGEANRLPCLPSIPFDVAQKARRSLRLGTLLDGSCIERDWRHLLKTER